MGMDGIRESVAMTAVFSDMVSHASFTVWKYLGTTDGVFRVFPGISLVKPYDHTLRPWHRRIIGNKGRITLTVPYEDAFGAGSVITLGHTLYEGRESGIHSNDDLPVAVLAVDFTMHHFNYLLKTRFPFCSDVGFTCFVLDRSGFLVIHPSFLQAGAEIEGVHIVKKEPEIAKELIDINVMNTEGCIDFENIQNYTYWRVFLTGGEAIVTNEYELHEVPNSNIFLVVKKGRLNQPTLCRCVSHCVVNTYITCYCPCSEDADFEYCRNTYTKEEASRAPCTPRAETLDLSAVSEEERRKARASKQCSAVDCDDKSEEECGWQEQCQWNENKCKSADGVSEDKEDGGSDGLSLGAIVGIVVGADLLLIYVVIGVVCLFRRHKKGTNTRGHEAGVRREVNTAYGEASPSAPPPPYSDVMQSHY